MTSNSESLYFPLKVNVEISVTYLSQEVNVKSKKNKITFFIVANINIFFLNCKIFMLMNLDIDFLMEFMKKNTRPISKKDLGEQDSSPEGETSSGGQGRAIKKWETVEAISKNPADLRSNIDLMTRVCESFTG